MTNQKNIKKSIKYKQYDNWLKPNGLWYSCFGSWHKHIIDENMKYKFKKYIQKINIYKNRLTDPRLHDLSDEII
jgi:hypothetical protein